MTPNITSFIST